MIGDAHPYAYLPGRERRSTAISFKEFLISILQNHLKNKSYAEYTLGYATLGNTGKSPMYYLRQPKHARNRIRLKEWCHCGPSNAGLSETFRVSYINHNHGLGIFRREIALLASLFRICQDLGEERNQTLLLRYRITYPPYRVVCTPYSVHTTP